MSILFIRGHKTVLMLNMAFVKSIKVEGFVFEVNPSDGEPFEFEALNLEEAKEAVSRAALL